MMCEECGIRPAKFHLMTITNDERTERNLCSVCMAKYQKQLPGIDFSNLAGILNSINFRMTCRGAVDFSGVVTGGNNLSVSHNHTAYRNIFR